MANRWSRFPTVPNCSRAASIPMPQRGWAISRTIRAAERWSARLLYAFNSRGARGVTVKGLIVEKYATPAQQGAIFGDEHPRATDWLIEDNESASTADPGSRRGEEHGRRNKVHHNGQLGISPNGSDVVIEGQPEYLEQHLRLRCCLGGRRRQGRQGQRLTLRGDHVHDNYGQGSGAMSTAAPVTVSRTISSSAIRTPNLLRDRFDAIITNGKFAGQDRTWRPAGAAPGSGAPASRSAIEGVSVPGNKMPCASGGTGIVDIDEIKVAGWLDQPRLKDGQKSLFYLTARNAVHDNEIVYGGNSTLSATNEQTRFQSNFRIIETGRQFDLPYHAARAVQPALHLGGSRISTNASAISAR